MRSDREEVPGGFTKEEADQAEIAEAQLQMARVAPGCQIYWPSPFEVCGVIRDKYNSLGGSGGFLLWPKSAELTNPDGVGKRTEFVNGPIYWHPETGAHPVLNHFMMKWGEKQWTQGFLGYPKSDEILLNSSTDNIGRRQEFQGGNIYWHPVRGVVSAVGGAILTKYLEKDAQNGPLGYPRSDEIVLPDGVGRMNSFEFGNIYWSPSTNAHPVVGKDDPNPFVGRIFGKWAATGYEGGSYGYPISDEAPAGSGVARAGNDKTEQVFQNGKIGQPLVKLGEDGYDDTDWAGDDDDSINDSNCDGCGDDARIETTGAAYLGDIPAGMSRNATLDSGAATTPVAGAPLCDTVVADLDAEDGTVGMCYLPYEIPLDDDTSVPTESAPGAENDAPMSARSSSYTSAVRDWCSDKPQAKWYGERDYACNITPGSILYFDVKNPGVQVGVVVFVEEHEVEPEYNSLAWKARAALHITGTSGIGKEVLVSGTSFCQISGGGGTCNSTSDGDLTESPVVNNPDFLRKYTMSGTLTGGSRVSVGGYYKWTFRTLDTRMKPQTESVINPKVVVRCDNEAYNRGTVGCVVEDAEPIMSALRPNTPAISAHIFDAQISGLPGMPNDVPLTRTTDRQITKDNRNASCNAIRGAGTRPTGHSCDEYPFAKTLEGAASGGTAKTFSGCFIGPPKQNWVTVINRPVTDFVSSTGHTMCMVDASQNSRLGGVQSWFFTKSRVLDGDRFYVNAGGIR